MRGRRQHGTRHTRQGDAPGHQRGDVGRESDGSGGGVRHERHPGARGELELLRVLLDLKVLRYADETWILGRSLKSLTLWDLYQRLPDGLDGPRLDAVEGMDNVVEPLKALVQFGSNQMAVSLETVFGGTA